MRGDNPAHVRLMTLLNVGAAVPSVEDVGTKTLGKRARALGASCGGQAQGRPARAG